MQRVIEVKTAGQWDFNQQVDRVLLDAADRHRRRMVLTGESGTQFLLDLAAATILGDGDGLVLDDGSIVGVTGLAEPLVEASSRSARESVRLAWHLGNRHADVQIMDGKLRFRRDHVLEEMATRLGATLTAISAAFQPEQPGGRAS
jgi:urease accessory protein